MQTFEKKNRVNIPSPLNLNYTMSSMCRTSEKNRVEMLPHDHRIGMASQKTKSYINQSSRKQYQKATKK